MPEIIREKKQPIDSRIERNIITGMIMSDNFLREVQPLLTKGKFQVDFVSTVSQWCLEYWDKYFKSPKKDIEDIFFNQRKGIEEEKSNLIEDFLTSINDEYERADNFNYEYILDEAETYFSLTSLKELYTELGKVIKGGRPDEGENLVKKYQRPERLKSKGVDPLRDKDFIAEATKPAEDNPNVLFTFPGALGKACGPLERGFLMAFQAESGVGKTWWLWFLSRISVFAGYNSAIISLEMNEKKMGRRIWQDLTGSPTRGGGEVLIPVFDCVYNQNNSCSNPSRRSRVGLLGKNGIVPEPGKEPKGYKSCSFCRDTWGEDKLTTWWRKEQRDVLDPAVAINKHNILDESGFLKKCGKYHLVEFPTNSLTVDKAYSYLNNLEYYDNFILDFLATDYADKFKLDSTREKTWAIDRVWDFHKSLAQEKHCLVATASQSNTERNGKKVGKSSWAGSIEKRRGIDLGIAINQKTEDAQKGIIYLSVDKMRHEESVYSEVAVLQQLSIGRPYIDSCFVRK